MDTTKEKTHGNYRDTASISQGLKAVMASGKNWDNLNNSQREALEMISVKVSRILSGDANFRNHWDDIEGYAELGGENSKNSLPQVQFDLAKAMGA